MDLVFMKVRICMTSPSNALNRKRIELSIDCERHFIISIRGTTPHICKHLSMYWWLF